MWERVARAGGWLGRFLRIPDTENVTCWLVSGKREVVDVYRTGCKCSDNLGPSSLPKTTYNRSFWFTSVKIRKMCIIEVLVTGNLGWECVRGRKLGFEDHLSRTRLSSFGCSGSHSNSELYPNSVGSSAKLLWWGKFLNSELSTWLVNSSASRGRRGVIPPAHGFFAVCSNQVRPLWFWAEQTCLVR